MSLKTFLMSASIGLAVMSSVPASAATWTSTTGGDWANAANWGGAAPVSGDSLTFAGTATQTLTDTLTNTSFAVSGITFSGTGPYTTGGNAFLLTGAISDSAGSGTQTINNNIVLGGTQSVAAASVATIQLGGAISDGGNGYGLNITGAGTVVLAGNNGFSGGVNLSAGTLRLAGGPTATALGSGTLAVSGNVTLATNGGTTVLGGAATSANAITVAAATTLSLDGGYADLFLSGTISGDGALKATSSGSVFLLNANNGFTGGVTLSGSGTLWGSVIGNTGSNGSFGSANTVTIASFSALGYVGNGEASNRNINFSTGSGGIITNNAASSDMNALTLSNVTTANAAMGLTFNGGSDTLISNGIIGDSSTLNLTKSNVGMLTIANNSTTGNMFGSATASTLTVNGGVVVLNGSNVTDLGFTRAAGGGGAVWFGSASSVRTGTVNTNGILGGWATFNGTDWATNNAGIVTAYSGYVNDTWAAGNNTDVTTSASVASGSTTNSLRFNNAGSQTLTLAGTNYLTSGGILVTANAGSGANTTITGGTLTFGTSGASSTGDIIVNNFNAGGTLTLGSVIANNAAGGTTSLTVAGPGTTTLTATNTYSGTTYVEGGATLVNNGTHTTGGYQVAADSTLYLANGYGGSGPSVTVYGAGSTASTGLYLNGGQTYGIAALNLTGAATIIRTYGTGVATLSGYDTNATHLTVADTASGSIIGSNINLTTGTYGHAMNIAAGANTANGDLTIAGSLGGSGSTYSVGGVGINYEINRTGVSGSVKLTGVSTATGYAVEAGSLILSDGDNRLATNAIVALGGASNTNQAPTGSASALLVLNGVNQQLASVATAGTGTANAVVGGSAVTSTLTLGNTAAVTFSGNLGGAGTNQNNLAFVQAGTGTTTLSGANTLAGGIVANAGRVNVTGAANTAAITVNSGATFGGSVTGATTGLLTMNAGSTIALAGGATTTAFTSNGVVFAGSTTLVFDATQNTGTTYTVVNYGTGSLAGLANLSGTSRGVFADTGSAVTFTTGGVQTDIWNTASGTWDNAVSANWSNGFDSRFYAGDTVIFNDPGAASTVTLSGALSPAAVTINNGVNAYTFSGSGSIAGTGSVTMSGAGTATIATANTYSGGTFVNAGTLIAGNASAFGTGTITVNGGTLSAGTFTLGNAVTLTSGNLAGAGAYSGAVSLGGGSLTGTETFSGVVSGSGSVGVASSGTVTLANGANTFAGALNVTSGTLTYNTSVGNGGSYTMVDSGGVVTMGAGTKLNIIGTEANGYGAGITFTVGSTVNLNGATVNAGGTTGAMYQRLSSATSWALTGANTINQSQGGYGQYLGIEGAVSGTGSLTLGRQSGTASYIQLLGSLSGYSGDVTIASGGNATGAVIFGNASGWGSGALTLGGTNSTAIVGDYAANNYAVTQSGTWPGAALGFTTGTVAATGAITVNSGGNLQVNNAAGYAVVLQTNGGMNVNGGTLSANGSGGTSSFATNGSTWTFGGNAISTVSAAVQVSGSGTTFNVGSGSTATFSGAITGASAYTISGSGVALLNGSSATGGITVASGATLGGTGTLNEAVTVNGTLQGGAGAASGTLTTGAGAVTLASGSIVRLALGASGASSQIEVGAGGITFQNNQAFSFIDAGAATGAYTLITGAGSVNTTGWTIANAGWAGTFTDNAGTITLNLTAVPEPATFGLLGAGALAATAFVKRRRKK